MEGFFQARSIAVVGVSNSPGNLGRVMVHNLLEFRYEGLIHLVGPRGGYFLGHKIYPSILNVPDPVDLAAVLIPASAVPGVLRQCGEKGVTRVIIESAGFRELGKDRIALEEEVKHILDLYGMRMIGPNCIGIMNRHNGLAVPFMPFKAECFPGNVAVVSQSGGIGAVVVNSLAAENIGFSKFASIGNKLNINETDLIEYYIEDPRTSIIFCYLEGIADGRRLMELAFGSSKPIIIHKSNRGASGSLVAKSHSASLSTDDRIVDAAFNQCGMIRSYEQCEALETIKGFLLPQLIGNRLSVISRSGGHAVMAADAADEYGFVLPAFPEEIVQLVQKESRAHVIMPHNPMDLGDLYNLPLYLTLAEKTVAREDIDGLLFIHNYQGIFEVEESRNLIIGIGELVKRYGKPIALCVFTTHVEFERIRAMTTLPLFTDPRGALRVLAKNRDWHGTRPLPFTGKRPCAIDVGRARRELEDIPAGPVPMDILASILISYEIPLASWEIVDSEGGALEAAKRLGFPVVLKTGLADVVHKTDVGGVRLDIRDEPAVKRAYADLLNISPRVLVQTMSEPSVEWFIGGRQDNQFGPVLIVGLGGIYVEILRETSIRVCPISREEARRALDESRAVNILAGVRGAPPLDGEALVDIITRMSWLLYDFPEIVELDLNPVRVFPSGCLTLDWRATKVAIVQ